MPVTNKGRIFKPSLIALDMIGDLVSYSWFYDDFIKLIYWTVSRENGATSDNSWYRINYSLLELGLKYVDGITGDLPSQSSLYAYTGGQRYGVSSSLRKRNFFIFTARVKFSSGIDYGYTRFGLVGRWFSFGNRSASSFHPEISSLVRNEYPFGGGLTDVAYKSINVNDTEWHDYMILENFDIFEDMNVISVRTKYYIDGNLVAEFSKSSDINSQEYVDLLSPTVELICSVDNPSEYIILYVDYISLLSGKLKTLYSYPV